MLLLNNKMMNVMIDFIFFCFAFIRNNMIFKVSNEQIGVHAWDQAETMHQNRFYSHDFIVTSMSTYRPPITTTTHHLLTTTPTHHHTHSPSIHQCIYIETFCRRQNTVRCVGKDCLGIRLFPDPDVVEGANCYECFKFELFISWNT